MLNLCYNEENFCLRRIYEKNTFYAIHPGHHYAWDYFTNTITTLPTVLSDIAAGLGVDVSSLGLLTSLPLLTFAIFSPFAIQFAKKLGIERLFFLVLIAITIGSAIRIINLPFLYLGTILIGAGIAFLNVLLPSFIQANRPRQLGILTTLYITSMGMSTAIALLSLFRSPKPLLGKVWSTS